ncbi:MAG: formate--phosphoribosylaminoimidazolecarboxamide ligase family protein [Nitrososphaerota archaeon]|nr:formate--phosphoribosylaminoimidazolecarboxamide ligase family protein [Candidatus Calditenuaceae archaeon]MDW8074100.1 formate--phosphoribosylaminoimidazolecarboxamide ligase family protein [Nitrososphaerota archaeon]
MGLSIACIASHSALDVFDGAKDEGFPTIAICRRGREKIYAAARETVDKCIVLNDYREIIEERVQERLEKEGALIVPNRSMAVYVGYDEIERELRVPVFGNKRLLRWEERTGEKNYYRLLDEAGIRRPAVWSLDEVSGPVLLKVQEAGRPQERAFIFASGRDDLYAKVGEALRRGVVSEEQLRRSVAEELVLGAHFNINYFYSVARQRLEILSVDRRIQSSLDGILHLPAREQLELNPRMSMIEVGHIPVTLRESLLEEAFIIGERFVEAARRLEPPGVIGPFTLQVIVTSELRMVVYDVAPRIGGGTNAHLGLGGQYSKLFLRRPVSVGRRIAIEVREMSDEDGLDEITT